MKAFLAVSTLGDGTATERAAGVMEKRGYSPGGPGLREWIVEFSSGKTGL